MQPSLSGNARMAVVCCATPSELYLEETRSTLLFAGRAKLVKTNAQINEVLDDRSIIRRLQRELALARSQQHSSGLNIVADVVELENIAISAGRDAKMAKNKLKRLYTTILMNKNLDDTNANMILGCREHGNFDALCPFQNIVDMQKVQSPPRKRLCRRMSDGNLNQSLISNFISTPKLNRKQSHPFTDPPIMKKTSTSISIVDTLSPSDEVFMMRQAVAAKETKAVRAKRQTDHVLKQLQGKDLDLVAANCSNDLLRSERDEKSASCKTMTTEIEELKSEFERSKATYDALLVEKEVELTGLQFKINGQIEDRRVLEETLDLLQDSKVAIEQNLKASLTEKDTTISTLQNELEICRQELSHQMKVVNFELRQKLIKSEIEKEAFSTTLEASSQSLKLVSEDKDKLVTKNDELREEILSISCKFDAATIDTNKCNEDLRDANISIEQYLMKISNLENEQKGLEINSKCLNEHAVSLLTENTALKEDVVQLASKNEAVEAQMEEIRFEKSKLLGFLKVAELKLEGLLIVLKENENEKMEMYKKLATYSTVILDSEKVMLHQKSANSDLASQLLIANLNSTEAQESLNETNIRYNDLCKVLQKSNEDYLLLEQMNSATVISHKKVERSMSEMTYNYEEQLDDLRKAIYDAVEAESILKKKYSNNLTDAKNRIDAPTILLYRSARDNECLIEGSATSADSNFQLSATIDSLKERIDKDQKAYHDRVCELVSEQSATKILLNLNRERVAECECRIEGLVVALQQSYLEFDHALADNHLIRTESTSSKLSLQHSCVEILRLTGEIKILKSEASINIESIQRITSERDAALPVAVELQKWKESKKTNDQAYESEVVRLRHIDELEKECEACQLSLQSSKQIAEQILCLFETIDSEDETFKAPYKSIDEPDNILAKSWSQPLVPMLQTAHIRLGQLSTAFLDKTSTLKKQSDALSTLTENFHHLEKAIHEKETNYSRRSEHFKEENKCLVADLKQAKFEIENLKKSVDTNNAERMRSSSFEDFGCDDFKLENKELKQLLANANYSVEEGRISRKEMTKELYEKSQSLEILQMQFDNMENEMRNLAERQSTGQQLAKIQDLVIENERLELFLVNEKECRVQFEADLRGRMSNEQTRLIQEAEQAMRGLRGELEFKTSALKRSEAEAYAAREIKDDLEDQYRRTLDRAMQLESQIAALEMEANKLRRLSHRHQVDHESELVALKERLSSATSEKQENQSLINDTKETVNKLREEIYEVGQDLSAARELNIASNNKLEQKNSQLVSELHRLMREIELLQENAKEYNVKVKEYEYENDKLRQKLQAYVDRCEKLESSKLTKDKVAAIKKLMVGTST